MSIAIGYMPGAYGEEGEDHNYLRKLVEVGDKHGYDSLWLSDRIVGEKFSLEPMMACSMVTAYSDRLKVGTSVLAMPLRNPVVLAKQIATLDYLSQGRFFPAVGLGQEEPEEYEACGVTKERRGPRTDEAIQLMRRLWEEDDVTHEGEFFTCHNVTVTPKPYLQPSTPVWIGGRSPAAARRVGRVGDGWLVSSATPEEIKEGCSILFETANEYNREIEDDHIGILMGYYVSNDVAKATEKAERFITRPRPDAHFTEFTAVGPVEKVAEYIQTYIEAGGSKFVMRPMCSADETMEQLDILGEELLPQFHKK
ncbi:MAG: LLM class flavin-dependent oxidoreductase [Dehalococcoidia bacterium]